MQAFADRAAVSETLQSGLATFYSRSRRGRWCKVRLARLLRQSGGQLLTASSLVTVSGAVYSWRCTQAPLAQLLERRCCEVPLACKTHARTQARVPPACMSTNSDCMLKGETSGHYINVASVFPDCDRDSLVYLGDPIGPACHTVSSCPQLLPDCTSHTSELDPARCRMLIR